MNKAPVILFCYNRPEHTKKTIEALQKNTFAPESDLLIFSDAPKNEAARDGVQEVRSFLKTIKGFKSVRITEREENWGLAKSIIEGVSKTVNEYGNVIVIEDDLVTHPGFLKFMNEGLTKFEHNDQVASIHGFIFPIENLPENFFLKGADCWGWATWKRAWDLFNPDGKALLQQLEGQNLTKRFDFLGEYGYTQMLKDQIDGKVSSWAIRWYASAFLKDKLTLYPGKSLVKNIGYDTGTHFKQDARGETGDYFGTLSKVNIEIIDQPAVHNEEAYLSFVKFFKKQKKNIFVRIVNKIIKKLKS